ncbi:uncharacterized protein [Penaeus vannamei]|uniref:uncharacterized protein n=1 Tax=Penaeus vannamei TaxID=6689 RepID=UPI00387F4B5F
MPREQAGSQPKRGCIKHIVTTRLLLDVAKRKKFTLYVMFVEFSQAYDRAPRTTLFSTLRRLGCGAVMLAALVAMYPVTRSVVGTAIVTATVGNVDIPFYVKRRFFEAALMSSVLYGCESWVNGSLKPVVVI